MMEERTPPGFHHQVRRRRTLCTLFNTIKRNSEIETSLTAGATASGEECLDQSVPHRGEHEGRKPAAAGQQEDHDQGCGGRHGTWFGQRQQPSGEAVPGRGARRLAGGNDEQAWEGEVLVQVWMPDPRPTVARQATANDWAHPGGCGVCHSQVIYGP